MVDSKTYDKTEIVFKHIDTIIGSLIREGKNYDQILDSLDLKVEKFKKILKTCKKEETRYKFILTHNKVCEKRIFDFNYAKTLVSNYDEYETYSVDKMFKLIKLRDKIVDDFKVF